MSNLPFDPETQTLKVAFYAFVKHLGFALARKYRRLNVHHYLYKKGITNT